MSRRLLLACLLLAVAAPLARSDRQRGEGYSFEPPPGWTRLDSNTLSQLRGQQREHLERVGQPGQGRLLDGWTSTDPQYSAQPRVVIQLIAGRWFPIDDGNMRKFHTGLRKGSPPGMTYDRGRIISHQGRDAMLFEMRHTQGGIEQRGVLVVFMGREGLLQAIYVCAADDWKVLRPAFDASYQSFQVDPPKTGLEKLTPEKIGEYTAYAVMAGAVLFGVFYSIRQKARREEARERAWRGQEHDDL